MTDALLNEARGSQLTVRELARAHGLTYHRARELSRAAELSDDKTGWETTVVFSDVHVPFHDPMALQLVYRFISQTQPERIIINGDFLDCYTVSHFSKDPRRGGSLADEFRVGRELLRDLRRRAPDAHIIFISGNHEHRLHRYLINQARELAGLEGLSVEDQLKLGDLNIDWVPCSADRFIDTYVRLGNLLVGHFDKAAQFSGYTAKALLDKYGLSLIQGHVHSFGVSNKTLADGPIMAWEGGCLCDLEPIYCVPSKWVHGFHVIHREAHGTFFHVEPVLILNGDGEHRFFYGGRLWKATDGGDT